MHQQNELYPHSGMFFGYKKELITNMAKQGGALHEGKQKAHTEHLSHFVTVTE